MKFSEAMLLGLPEIEFTNQKWLVPKNIFNDKPIDECRGCLIGAALYSQGTRGTVIDVMVAIEKYWPRLAHFSAPTECPYCPYGLTDTGQRTIISNWIARAATHLADHYGRGEMSAEAIADFFRSVEPEEDAPKESLNENEIPTPEETRSLCEQIT